MQAKWELLKEKLAKRAREDEEKQRRQNDKSLGEVNNKRIFNEMTDSIFNCTYKKQLQIWLRECYYKKNYYM